MIDTGYLFSKDDQRIFINTSLGCTGQCSYCYLGKIGYDNKKIISKLKSAEDLIKELNDKIKISKDALITLGCFSECWDDNNKKETLKLIKYFLNNGNQIQLSTKKYINIEEISQFQKLIKYYGQLVIFVSTATISKWETFEKRTELPDNRFKTFEISKKLDVPTVLYIKPVLKDITIKDLELYKQLIIEKNIKDVVIGSIFTEKENDETVHFLNKGKLFYNPINDEDKIKMELKKIKNVRVFERSTEVMKFYKAK